MTALDRALAEVFTDLADEAPHDPALAGRVRRQARRRGLATVVGSAAAACAVALAGVAVAGHDRGTVAVSAVPSAPPCDGTPVKAVLPPWARAGFSDPQPVATFVRSRSGNVLGIFFGPWTRLPDHGWGTKVLWVWHEAPSGTGGPVRMSARLDGTDRVVSSGLPQPYGPSTVELPASGCWRVTISSPRGTDTVDLDTRQAG